MTTTLSILSSGVPPGAATRAPDPRPGAEFLTVTAHPVPPDAVVIMARGEVDLLTSSLLRDGILAQLHGPCRWLIIDLTAVGFFGAAGLTVLAIVREAALAMGTGLSLVAHTRSVLLPLTATGMHTAFDIYPDLALCRGRRPEQLTHEQPPDQPHPCADRQRPSLGHLTTGQVV
jgi:anti-sigma B factor antagonist